MRPILTARGGRIAHTVDDKVVRARWERSGRFARAGCRLTGLPLRRASPPQALLKPFRAAESVTRPRRDPRPQRRCR